MTFGTESIPKVYKIFGPGNQYVTFAKQFATRYSVSIDICARLVEVISGKKIDYSEWNKIIEDNDTLVIDVRNEFEVLMGSFKGAVNPKTKNFTDFKAFVKKNLANSKRKKI